MQEYLAIHLTSLNTPPPSFSTIDEDTMIASCKITWPFLWWQASPLQERTDATFCSDWFPNSFTQVTFFRQFSQSERVKGGWWAAPGNPASQKVHKPGQWGSFRPTYSTFWQTFPPHVGHFGEQKKRRHKRWGRFSGLGAFERWESGLVAENRVGGRCTRHSCRVVRVQERSLARCPGSAGPRGNKKSPSRNSGKELQSDRSLSELLRKSGPKIVAVPPLHACLHVGGSAQLDQTGHLAMTVAGSGLEQNSGSNTCQFPGYN